MGEGGKMEKVKFQENEYFSTQPILKMAYLFSR